jgi:cell division protease FtsH
MVTRFWMFEDIWAENFVWNIDSYSGQWERAFISDETTKKIDDKVKEILKNAYNIAIKLIKDNKDLHDTISKALLEKEEMSREEFEVYFKNLD